MNDEIQKIHTAADDDWAAIEKERTGGNSGSAAPAAAGTDTAPAGAGGSNAGTEVDAGAGGSNAGATADAGEGGSSAGATADAGEGGSNAGKAVSGKISSKADLPNAPQRKFSWKRSMEKASAKPGNRLGILSIIFGLLGFFIYPCALIGVILGIIALRKGRSKYIALTGIIVSIVVFAGAVSYNLHGRSQHPQAITGEQANAINQAVNETAQARSESTAGSKSAAYAAAMKPVLSAEYGDSYRISTDDTGCIIQIWHEGVGEAFDGIKKGSAELTAEWNDMKNSIQKMCTAAQNKFTSSVSKDGNVMVILLDDRDRNTVLLMYKDGICLYDAAAE
ncbi:MAG: DUF4190 domain-containing protein [Lachnospiraceae bacterium]|nr:DUF4190 domain-containing protein [Lachnospiraceae bacterium]